MDKCDTLFVICEKQKQINAEAEKRGEHKPFCSFCQRYMDRHEMIGPFVLDQPSKLRDKNIDFTISFVEALDPKKEVHGIYFHQKCLELNQYVKYDETLERYVNIRTALKYLVEQKYFSCYRCLGKGATLQCSYCDRSFHGHYCSVPKYVLAEDFNNTLFTCIFCKNNKNYEDYLNESGTGAELRKLMGKDIDT